MIGMFQKWWPLSGWGGRGEGKWDGGSAWRMGDKTGMRERERERKCKYMQMRRETVQRERERERERKGAWLHKICKWGEVLMTSATQRRRLRNKRWPISSPALHLPVSAPFPPRQIDTRFGTGNDAAWKPTYKLTYKFGWEMNLTSDFIAENEVD